MSKDLKVMAGGVYNLSGKLGTVSGIRKLGQKFLIELLTVTGSMTYLPERGCSFLARLRTSGRTEFDVTVAFAAAKNQIKRNMAADNTMQTPMDERYAGAHLYKIIIEAGVLHLDFAVRSRAGNIIRVLTPPILL